MKQASEGFTCVARKDDRPPPALKSGPGWLSGFGVCSTHFIVTARRMEKQHVRGNKKHVRGIAARGEEREEEGVRGGEVSE